MSCRVAADPPKLKNCFVAYSSGINDQIAAHLPKADRAAELKTWSKSLRLSHFDYTSTGYYFITICCKDKKPYFNDYRYSELVWRVLSKRFNTDLTALVLMPDHLHLIIESSGNGESLGETIMNIKREIWLGLRKQKLSSKSIFQRNYYEHVIRNEMDLREKIDYMMANPVRRGLAESVSEWRWSWHKWMG